MKSLTITAWNAHSKRIPNPPKSLSITVQFDPAEYQQKAPMKSEHRAFTKMVREIVSYFIGAEYVMRPTPTVWGTKKLRQFSRAVFVRAEIEGESFVYKDRLYEPNYKLGKNGK